MAVKKKSSLGGPKKTIPIKSNKKVEIYNFATLVFCISALSFGHSDLDPLQPALINNSLDVVSFIDTIRSTICQDYSLDKTNPTFGIALFG